MSTDAIWFRLPPAPSAIPQAPETPPAPAVPVTIDGREVTAEAGATILDACRTAGIRPIMVTGDHPGTARAVAREIGLGGGDPTVITGDELEAHVARGEAEVARRADVVARAAPPQKLTLVRTLQAAGEIVAVTGDGVNDVPALQAADIGIAMGERGTQSAREVAAIVLLDDNFRTIVGAIAEGRQLFRNLQLSFRYLLMFHFPFIASALLVPLSGYPLLYLPVHIVWVELVIHATALLVFQELPRGGLERRWAPRVVRFFSAREWIRELAPEDAWDLYSGVGGFALHLAGGGTDVTGIETSVEAVASAELSRTDAALSRVRFAAGDATAFALSAPSAPDLVVVNPPRRGIGAELAGWLERSGAAHVLYSSCNAASLAKDLAAMPSLRPVKARVFDMFPQTTHFEVMVLLEHARSPLVE